MKTYEELARLRVQEAIQNGIRAQHIGRQLGVGASVGKISRPHFPALWQAMLKKMLRLDAGEFPEPHRRQPAGPDRKAA